jgi:ribosomal protein S18 acetylase RimI-like enzyme
VLKLARGLSAGDLRAVADLERRVVDADGGRLKLEWGVLQTRGGQRVEDVLWWERGRLLGFVGLYAFAPPTVELAGMVDPSARRHGIATALLDAAVELGVERGYEQALLVTPRGSVAGRAFAQSRGALLEHSEHALVLHGAPADGPADPQITLRAATPADASDLSRLLAAGFGEAPSDLIERMSEDSARTLVAEREGSVVGTVRVTQERDDGRVYGFAVDPAVPGRGLGGDILRGVCRQFRADGAERIGLEVAIDNDHALGLYTSLGFTQVTTEDYYELPLRQFK